MELKNVLGCVCGGEGCRRQKREEEAKVSGHRPAARAPTWVACSADGWGGATSSGRGVPTRRLAMRAARRAAEAETAAKTAETVGGGAAEEGRSGGQSTSEDGLEELGCWAPI